MLASRWTGVRVLNHGVDGDTVEDLLSRVDEVKAENPDRVWLMVGTNDCGWGVDAEVYKAGLRSLVRQLKPARVVLITPTTSVFYKGANAPYVAAANEVGREEGVPVIDFASEIADSDYGFDGLHWNSEGHSRLADLLDRWWQEKRHRT